MTTKTNTLVELPASLAAPIKDARTHLAAAKDLLEALGRPQANRPELVAKATKAYAGVVTAMNAAAVALEALMFTPEEREFAQMIPTLLVKAEQAWPSERAIAKVSTKEGAVTFTFPAGETLASAEDVCKKGPWRVSPLREMLMPEAFERVRPEAFEDFGKAVEAELAKLLRPDPEVNRFVAEHAARQLVAEHAARQLVAAKAARQLVAAKKPPELGCDYPEIGETSDAFKRCRVGMWRLEGVDREEALSRVMLAYHPDVAGEAMTAEGVNRRVGYALVRDSDEITWDNIEGVRNALEVAAKRKASEEDTGLRDVHVTATFAARPWQSPDVREAPTRSIAEHLEKLRGRAHPFDIRFRVKGCEMRVVSHLPGGVGLRGADAKGHAWGCVLEDRAQARLTQKDGVYIIDVITTEDGAELREESMERPSREARLRELARRQGDAVAVFIPPGTIAVGGGRVKA